MEANAQQLPHEPWSLTRGMHLEYLKSYYNILFDEKLINALTYLFIPKVEGSHKYLIHQLKFDYLAFDDEEIEHLWY